jgi:hypothetical protein
LVDGSFVEDKVVKAPADSGAWPEFGASAATVALLIMMYLVSTAVLLPATIPAAAGYRITRVPWSSAARVIGPALASGILTLVLGAAGLLLLVLPGIWLLVQLQRGPGGARRRGTPRIRGAPPVQVARDRTMVGDVRPARDRLAPGR